MILCMCFPALVLLYGASGEFNNGSIVIEFPNETSAGLTGTGNF